MKSLIFLVLIVMCGCNNSLTVEREKEPIKMITSQAPVIIRAKVITDYGGDKYYYYDIIPLEVIKNTINFKLSSPLKVARVNYLKKIQENKTYILELYYYNEAHPEYGLKIMKFKEI